MASREIKAAFSIIALALPGHLKHDYELLVKFLKKKLPDYEIVLVDPDYSGPVKGYKWTPLTFDGKQIYIKRAA